jgi:hypothetical protein
VRDKNNPSNVTVKSITISCLGTSTTSTSTSSAKNCSVNLSPFDSNTYYTYNLGTTSGTVTVTSDVSACSSAIFTVYYPAVANSQNIIHTGNSTNCSFTYNYNGTNTEVLIIYDNSPC